MLATSRRTTVFTFRVTALSLPSSVSAWGRFDVNRHRGPPDQEPPNARLAAIFWLMLRHAKSGFLRRRHAACEWSYRHTRRPTPAMRAAVLRKCAGAWRKVRARKSHRLLAPPRRRAAVWALRWKRSGGLTLHKFDGLV